MNEVGLKSNNKPLQTRFFNVIIATMIANEFSESKSYIYRHTNRSTIERRQRRRKS